MSSVSRNPWYYAEEAPGSSNLHARKERPGSCAAGIHATIGESGRIVDALGAAEKSMSIAKSNQELEQDFRRLAAAWKRETKHLSRIDQVCANPSYLQIIGMGADALPMIFRELEKEIDYWFVALSAITRTSPVTDAEGMTPERMAEAWLQWGREHGFI